VSKVNSQDLNIGDVLVVNTQNTEYTFVVKGKTEKGNLVYTMVSTNPRYPGPCDCHLIGTSSEEAGSYVIREGLSLGILAGTKLITTTRIDGLSVNAKPGGVGRIMN